MTKKLFVQPSLLFNLLRVLPSNNVARFSTFRGNAPRDLTPCKMAAAS